MYRLMGLFVLVVTGLNLRLSLTQQELPGQVADFALTENRTLGQILDMEFMPDSSQLIVSSYAGLYLYDIAPFTRQRTLSMDLVGDIDLSPDGKKLVYSYADQIHILAMQSEGAETVIETSPADPDAVISLPTFAPDSQMLATAYVFPYQKIEISIWTPAADGANYQSRTLVLDVQVDAPSSTSLQWTSDGENVILCAGLYMTVIRVSDFSVIYEDANLPWDAELSPDGQHLLVTNATGITLLDVDSWQVERTWSSDEWEIYSGQVVWSPLENVIFCRMRDSSAFAILNLDSGKHEVISTFDPPANLSALHILRWSPDGNTLVVATNDLDGFITLLDTLTWEIQHQEMTRISNHNGNVAWSDDGKLIQSTEYLINVETFTTVLHFPYQQSGSAFIFGQMSPSGAYLATLSGEQELSIIDATTGDSTDHNSLPFLVQAMRWSTNGHYLAILSQGKTVTVRFLSLTDGLVVDNQSLTLPATTQQFGDLYWSPKDNYLIIADSIFAFSSQGDTLQLQSLWQLDPYSYFILGSWSSDERVLAVVTYEDDKSFVQLLDTLAGTVLASAQLPPIDEEGYVDSIYRAAWSPDGSYIAFGHESGAISLWLAASEDNEFLFEEVEVLEKHLPVSVGWGASSSEVTGLHWASDTELQSLGADGVLRIWRAPS